MSEAKLPAYNVLDSELKNHSLAVSPSELHGLLMGMICGGLTVSDESWVAAVSDYANQGDPLLDSAKATVRQVFDAASGELHSMAQVLFTSTAAELAESQFEVTLLLPAEDEALDVRAEALSEWVTNFISGMGLMGMKKAELTPDVTEAVAALEEIAQLGINEDEDMEEQALLLEQIIAYVPECVLSCLVGLGQRPESVEQPNIPGMPADDEPTLH
ncbi:UPF0149 family protein [Photobacterium sanguinicancri]|uniref:UPF0149 family protein n=1 Tax=Photobacterium sanguinicancri TaxID=875932 RepID=UPI0021C2C6A5|nr:UPF0149 family protein [Photobacterium sanguinicancri]